MAFFNSAVGVLQTLVIALGAGLGIWGAINLLEGYGNDNPGAKSQGMKQLAIEHDEYDAADFMDGINGMIAGLVANYEKVKGAETLMSRNKVIGTCPHCGAEVLEKQKGWFCSNRECRFILWKDNAYFTKIGKRLTTPSTARISN